MLGSVLQRRYEIQQKLGKHLDQQTLLALDLQTRELVVVKLLMFNQDLTWETVKLFEREAKTLQGLSHPAIPRYLDYFDVETTSGKGFAFVQSYIDAPSLAEHVKAGRTFSEAELKQIAKAVLEVLIYLHSRHPSVIHRDIKPDNILLADCSGNHVGQVYLIDFGSVQTVAGGGTRTVVGTYGYMPLEQFGERAVPASDLYGLGATLIYLASGQHPADLPQKNFRICFESAVNLSPHFVDWLQWMTESSLEDRLESARHALEALEHGTLRKKQPSGPMRPTLSNVVLTKKRNLEICIPPQGLDLKLQPELEFFRFFVPCFLFVYLVFYVPPVLELVKIYAPLGWLLLLVPQVVMVESWEFLLKILFAKFGKVWLRVDQNKISLTYQLFGLSFHRTSPALRPQVTRLEKTWAPAKKFYATKFGSSRVERQPQLNIWVGDKKFKICGSGLLSEDELDWLANELSVWLGLPTTRKK